MESKRSSNQSLSLIWFYRSFNNVMLLVFYRCYGFQDVEPRPWLGLCISDALLPWVLGSSGHDWQCYHQAADWCSTATTCVDARVSFPMSSSWHVSDVTFTWNYMLIRYNLLYHNVKLVFIIKNVWLIYLSSYYTDASPLLPSLSAYSHSSSNIFLNCRMT